MDNRRRDVSPPNALHRVADDPGFGAQLGVVREMLELTPAAAIHHVVPTRGLYSLRRYYAQLAELDAGKAAFRRELYDPHVARGGSWYEYDATIGAPDAIAPRGDRIDGHLRLHAHLLRSPARRPARSQESS
jgi:hypothetical protein